MLGALNHIVYNIYRLYVFRLTTKSTEESSVPSSFPRTSSARPKLYQMLCFQVNHHKCLFILQSNAIGSYLFCFDVSSVDSDPDPASDPDQDLDHSSDPDLDQYSDFDPAYDPDLDTFFEIDPTFDPDLNQDLSSVPIYSVCCCVI